MTPFGTLTVGEEPGTFLLPPSGRSPPIGCGHLSVACMSIETLLGQIVGPVGALIVLALATWALWREHVKDDDQKDSTIKTLTDTVGAFPGALKDLTSVVVAAAEHERNRPKSERAGDG